MVIGSVFLGTVRIAAGSSDRSAKGSAHYLFAVLLLHGLGQLAPAMARQLLRG